MVENGQKAFIFCTLPTDDKKKLIKMTGFCRLSAKTQQKWAGFEQK